jgi:tRNA(adenine34) deaminase
MYHQANNDTNFMQQALQLAQKAYSLGEVPIGAIVVSPMGEVLGQGFNETETKGCQDQHAEINAIRAACQKKGDWRLDGCTIYVTLEPCLMCFGCIDLSRIERLVYAADSPLFGYHHAREPLLESSRHVKNITSGICKEESETLLKKFFKDKRVIA